MQITVGLITVSDRASEGVYDDLGGPALPEAAMKNGWSVLAEAIVPDDLGKIQDAIRSFCAQGCGLILTTGGTGIAARDVTPEATRGLMRVELPGFGDVMRAKSMKITPNPTHSSTRPAELEPATVPARGFIAEGTLEEATDAPVAECGTAITTLRQPGEIHQSDDTTYTGAPAIRHGQRNLPGHVSVTGRGGPGRRTPEQAGTNGRGGPLSGRPGRSGGGAGR
mgnify:CR=1 FL=1